MSGHREPSPRGRSRAAHAFGPVSGPLDRHGADGWTWGPLHATGQEFKSHGADVIGVGEVPYSEHLAPWVKGQPTCPRDLCCNFSR
jgi:hypothetical protein